MILTSIVLSALTFALYPEITATPMIWIVDPRGLPHSPYSSITAAFAAAEDNDIILVRNGTYYEHIHVNKSVTIKWSNYADPELPPHRATVDGNGTGIVFNVNASNVQIADFAIRNASEGIYLSPNAINASVIGNFVNSNTEYGVHVKSVNNTIKGNTLTDENNFGIYVASSGNFLRNNKMTNNTCNFGISIFTNNDIGPSNTVNGKPIYILIDEHDMQVTNAGYVAVVNSTNITVEDAKLSNNDYGLQFIHTSNSNITNVEASHNLIAGIHILESENIRINYASSSYNGPSGTGISLRATNFSWISENMVSDNFIGIDLLGCIGNNFTDNIIQNNGWEGFGVANGTAIEDFSGSGNRFYHNNIKNNTETDYNRQVKLIDSEESWDNGEEGNYWSDYKDIYPDVEDSDGDGIWNYYLKINDANYDHCPLVEQWKSVRLFNVGKTWPDGVFKGYNMTVHCNHVIASLNFKRIGDEKYPRLLTFNVTAGSLGSCNITIPRMWLDGPFTITLDEVPKTFQLTQNANDSSLHFTYTEGKYQVRITGIKSGTVEGDLNGDGKIDLKDYMSVALKYGEQLPENLAP